MSLKQGINAMVFYTVSIFKSAGSSLDGRYATIIIGFVQLIFTAASGLVVDRFGRRILMMGSAAVCSLSLASMGSFFYMQSLWGEEAATESLGWLPLLSLIVFFIAYSAGMANVPFIIMGEMLPARYRAMLGPMSSSFNLMCTFTVVRSFPVMQVSMTKHGVFWFFMCCTLASIVFVFFLLPETNGKTLEDIEKLFSKKAAANVTTNEAEANDGNDVVRVKHLNTLDVVELGKSDQPSNGANYLKNHNPDDSDEEDDGSLVLAPP